jgi:hypothetical protein
VLCSGEGVETVRGGFEENAVGCDLRAALLYIIKEKTAVFG